MNKQVRIIACFGGLNKALSALAPALAEAVRAFGAFTAAVEDAPEFHDSSEWTGHDGRSPMDILRDWWRG